jgi:predicted phage tail component-like protein
VIEATLDAVTLASACPEAVITRVNRPLGGTVRTEFVEVPGRAGAWAFDEEPGEMPIVVDIDVLVDDIADRRAAIATLRGWAQTPSGRSQLIFDDEPDRYWSVKLSAAPPMEDDEYFGRTTLTFSAEPYAFDTTPSTQDEVASGSPDSGSFAVDDDVDAEPEVVITPTNGTIASFALTVNGEEVAWQVGTGSPVTILSGQSITVSSISDTVLLGASGDVNLTGAFDPDDVDMVTVAITGFPVLTNGTNNWSLSWTGTATSVDVDFAWRRRYV